MQRAQLRAARALLGWSQNDLAVASGVSAPTIKRIEPGEGPVTTSDDIILKIETAFHFAGIEFLSGEDGVAGGYGVRLAQKDDLARLRALQLRIGEATKALQAADRLATGSSVATLISNARSALINADALLSLELGNEEFKDHPVAIGWQQRS